MTVWQARRSGANRVLCGRMVGGRYVCQGDIAIVMGGAVWPPKGMVEEPPGSGFWRLTSRAARKLAAGVQPYAQTMARHPDQRPDNWESPAYTAPPLPWRRQCPHCGQLAEVSERVLHS